MVDMEKDKENYLSKLTKEQRRVLAICIPIALFFVAWGISANMNWLTVRVNLTIVHMDRVWGVWFTYVMIVCILEFILYGAKKK